MLLQEWHECISPSDEGRVVERHGFVCLRRCGRCHGSRATEQEEENHSVSHGSEGTSTGGIGSGSGIGQ